MMKEEKRFIGQSNNRLFPVGYLNKIAKGRDTRVISVTSGKGGVGKTNIATNLAYALVQLGKKVLVFDADLGLANIDILLGITPEFTIEHVIRGNKRLSDVIVHTEEGIDILPGSSGVEELTNLSLFQKKRLIDEFSLLNEVYEFIIIDTPAGISSNVIYFNLAASEILNILEPDPTSFTDAYALMKILSIKYGVNEFKIIVNCVDSESQAKDIFHKMNLVCEKFLNIKLQYIGYILKDEKLVNAVRRQRPVIELHPYSKASRCIHHICNTLCNIDSEPKHSMGFKRFLNKLFGREKGKDNNDEIRQDSSLI